jgi:hypothetical protein
VDPGGLQADWHQDYIAQKAQELAKHAEAKRWPSSTSDEDFVISVPEIFSNVSHADAWTIGAAAWNIWVKRNPRRAQVDPGGLQDEWMEKYAGVYARKLVDAMVTRGVPLGAKYDQGRMGDYAWSKPLDQSAFNQAAHYAYKTLPRARRVAIGRMAWEMWVSKERSRTAQVDPGGMQSDWVTANRKKCVHRLWKKIDQLKKISPYLPPVHEIIEEMFPDYSYREQEEIRKAAGDAEKLQHTLDSLPPL